MSGYAGPGFANAGMPTAEDIKFMEATTRLGKRGENRNFGRDIRDILTTTGGSPLVVPVNTAALHASTNVPSKLLGTPLANVAAGPSR